MKKVLEVNVDDLYSGGVFSLVRNVVSNNQQDIKIDIGAIEPFVNKNNIDYFSRFDTKVFYIGGKGNWLRKQILCYKNLKKLLMSEKYDYVHIHSDVSYKMIAVGLAAKHSGLKQIILHSHAAGIDGNYRFLKYIIHKIGNLYLRKIGTKFVACSRLAGKWMFPYIPIEEVIIINNGVDLNKFRYNEDLRNKVRGELGVSNSFIIGHVGRLCYQKNHEFLINIINNVKNNIPNVKLLLIGEGPDENKIKMIVKQQGLSNHVLFYGISDKVNELLQAMDVFVLPSHFEGLPIVGVEAQAAGLPVIFSDKITREAKIINNVSFLSINEDNINEWSTKILQYANLDRVDTYEEMKSKKFDIHDTVDSFISLYK